MTLTQINERIKDLGARIRRGQGGDRLKQVYQKLHREQLEMMEQEGFVVPEPNELVMTMPYGKRNDLLKA